MNKDFLDKLNNENNQNKNLNEVVAEVSDLRGNLKSLTTDLKRINDISINELDKSLIERLTELLKEFPKPDHNNNFYIGFTEKVTHS